MTENEALKMVEGMVIAKECDMVRTFELKRVLIKALEDIQAYRTIGTVEDIQEVMALCKSLQETVCKYMDIGTIEEFKAMKEKSEPMQWIEEDMGEGETLWKCPDCNEYWALMEGTPKDNQYNFCPECGRALKLSE